MLISAAILYYLCYQWSKYNIFLFHSNNSIHETVALRFSVYSPYTLQEGQLPPGPGPMHYPATYQEQLYGEFGPHTPTSVISPEYFDEQV